MQLRTAFIVILIFLASEWTNGQSNELYLLDSTAFAALESNASDVTEKANKLLEAGIRANAPVQQINAYTILGITNKNKGYYVTAVEFYNKALTVAENSNDTGRISACYNNIGTVYQIQENYSKALAYFQRSLAMEEQLNNPLQKSIRLYNIGDMYRKMDSLTLSLSNFNNSLMIEKEHNNAIGVVYALLGIADVYLKLDRTTDASVTLTEASKFLDKKVPETHILINLLYARLYRKQDKFDLARSFLSKAKASAKKYDLKVYQSDILEEEVAINEASENALKKDTESSSVLRYWWILALIIGGALLLSKAPSFLRKRRDSQNLEEHEELNNELEPRAMFVLKNNSGKIVLEIEADRVISFEANDNYVITYYLSNDNTLQKSMERTSLKKIEALIEGNSNFYRVHKSYVINKKHLLSVGGKSQAYKINMQFLKEPIPVSRSFDINQISE
ncbi:MAG: tetratricopeptide repeat protein [bacterium]|nr:tetratricopeptide repeat protein [bacterium]